MGVRRWLATAAIGLVVWAVAIPVVAQAQTSATDRSVTPHRPKPKPTPTPSVSPSPSPTPSPPPAGGCALPAYPKPSCTGVPAGVTFVNTVTGDYDATVAGQVIDRWHITGDLLIKAPDVAVTNSQIDRSVFNRFGPGSDPQTNTYPYTITDSTIGPPTGCIRAAGLQEANYTATRVHIRGVDHGVDVSEPGHVLLQDSFVTLCWLDATAAPPDGSHVDGIQSYCPDGPCTGVQLLHNTMIDLTHKGTFVINLVDPNVSAVTVNDNLLYGGDNYVIVTQWRSGPDWVLHNNRVVDGTWGTAAPASAEGTCANQDWSGNSIVTIDADYNVTSTVAPLDCIN